MSDIELKLNYIECPKCKNSYALYMHRKSVERNGMCDHCFREKEQVVDMVNHPPHYKDRSGIECIEVTKQGRKDDSSKRRYSLLPKGAVNSVVDVLEFGSKKYADNNWQKVENSRTRYYDAAMRHIDAWFNGDLKDAETGLPHLAHAICCLMFLMWFDSEANDD